MSNIIQLSVDKKYYGRVLDSSEVFELQQLQIHLSNIVDITNHKHSNTTDDTVNYIGNSLDEGLNTLFKIRFKLLGY